MKKQALCIITGIVQGVFYRDTTQEKAQELGLTGWVRNKSDGSVELCAEGLQEEVEKLIDWCWEGPPSAKVEDIKIQWKTLPPQENGFRSFEVRY